MPSADYQKYIYILASNYLNDSIDDTVKMIKNYTLAYNYRTFLFGLGLYEIDESFLVRAS